jgi:hypothetical protein
MSKKADWAAYEPNKEINSLRNQAHDEKVRRTRITDVEENSVNTSLNNEEEDSICILHKRR